MPTTKKRISLTLEDEMVALLERHRRELSVGRAESISGAATDLIRRGADVYYRSRKPNLTIAANADNIDPEKREQVIKDATKKAIDKYWGSDDDGERQDR